MMDHPEPSVMNVPLVGSRPTVSRATMPRRDPRPGAARPEVRGRSLYVGDDKLWLRGATYGTFLPAVVGDDGYDAVVVDDDFAMMAASGLNAVRLYRSRPPGSSTAPSDTGCGCRSACHGSSTSRSSTTGCPGDDRGARPRWRSPLRRPPGRPGCAIGNEIPSRIVRWQGIVASSVPRAPRRRRQEAERPGRSSPSRTTRRRSTSASAVPRLRLVQRVPRAARGDRALPRSPAEPGRRPAAA